MDKIRQGKATYVRCIAFDRFTLLYFTSISLNSSTPLHSIIHDFSSDICTSGMYDALAEGSENARFNDAGHKEQFDVTMTPEP